MEEEQPTETSKEAAPSVRDSLESLLRQQMMAAAPPVQPQPQVSLPVGSQKRKTKKASSGAGGGSKMIKRARKSEEEVTSTQNSSALMKAVSKP